MATSERIRAFLNSPTDRGECKPDTWGTWLRSALVALVDEDESFSGKRPLGNSDWGSDLTEALESHDLTFDEVTHYLFSDATPPTPEAPSGALDPRTLLAGMAMQGLLACDATYDTTMDLATDAVRNADALLAALKGEGVAL